MRPFGTYRTASGRSVAQSLAMHGEKAKFAVGRQLYLEALGIVAQSQGLVPVDTGTLRSSAFVQQPVTIGTTIRVRFGYGGAAGKINPKTGESASGYAVHVHENLEAHHPVGIAKYLELPFNQAKRGMGKRIAAGVRSDLGGIKL